MFMKARGDLGRGSGGSGGWWCGVAKWCGNISVTVGGREEWEEGEWWDDGAEERSKDEGQGTWWGEDGEGKTGWW